MPLIITSEEVASPLFYRLPPRQSFILLAASCVYDGSALNADFVPVLNVLGPDSWFMFAFGRDLLVLQHGGPFVTFAPHLSPAQPHVASTDNALTTGMPQLEYGPGTYLVFGGTALTSTGTDPAVTCSDMTLYVEPTGGHDDALAYGPFMLVPGPGAGL